MKKIDVDRSQFALQEISEMAQEEMITLARGDTSLAVVMSIVEYNEVQRLKVELARSNSENSDELL